MRMEMHHRSIIGSGICLALGCIVGPPAAAQDAENPASDTCVLEMNLPDDATVTIDGRDYGAKRKLTFGSLRSGQQYTSTVRVRFPDGATEERKVFIEGGKLIRLPISAPGRNLPKLVLQTGHTVDVASAAFSPDGRYVLTASCSPIFPGGFYPGELIVWDAATGRQLRTYSRGDQFHSVAWSPDGKKFLSADATEAKLWDVATGERLCSFRGKFHMSATVFSPDGRQVLTAGGTFKDDGAMGGRGRGEVIVWDTSTGRKLREFAYEDWCKAVTFNPNGDLIFVSFDGLRGLGGIVLDAHSGKEICRIKEPASAADSFSPDGKGILTGEFKGAAVCWDASTGRKVRVYTETSPPKSENKYSFMPDWSYRPVAYSSDGNYVIAGVRAAVPKMGTGRAIVWDAASGKQLHAFSAKDDRVRAVDFDAEGKKVLTSDGRTVSLWGPAERREAPCPPGTHEAPRFRSKCERSGRYHGHRSYVPSYRPRTHPTIRWLPAGC